MALRLFIAAIITLTATLTAAAAGHNLDESMDFWRSQAFYCDDGNGHRFPSKQREPTVDNPSPCDDGDMTLFNGLLCAAGEEIGCQAVALSQGKDGRWWRSPRRIGFEAPKHDVSFSPDQALGVMHYTVQKHDATAFHNWLTWIDTNRPCILKIGTNCIVQGWPRLCPDDQTDKRCTFRPGTCAEFELVGGLYKDESAKICRNVLKAYGMDVDDFIYPVQLLATGAAVVNEENFPLHLAAVELFLLGRTGYNAREGGTILAARDSGNPFFLFLAGEAPDKVRDLLLNECPTPEKPSEHRFQWSWERPSADEPWKNSMYWDCIFMGKLLGSTH
ncbi:hypothetical protein FHT79_003242 [Rhizobium sp. BK212]|uniref:hypothetical protein n=1 Tax=Rhizobium sp. BK212 TaxID=2587074 RepID=UPI00160B3D5A|nr:hypothetical protein [Rhizobium sp. BK212]MBB4216055.1 hypothetical protein [Rhizobium sp. BK212]